MTNFPGGRFGNLFDDDPKQWRMYADFIGSAGRYKCNPVSFLSHLSSVLNEQDETVNFYVQYL